MTQEKQPDPHDASDDENVVISLDGAYDDPQRFPLVEDSPVGFVQVDLDKQDDGGDEEDEDLFVVGSDGDLVMQELALHTDDDQVLDDFTERQELGQPDELLETLRRHHSKSPEISGDDVDADWAGADQSGEEAVGGSVPTPGQNVVEDLGIALGIEYADDEPLDTVGKLRRRDEHRWELDPASAEDDDNWLEDDLDL